MSEIMLQQTQAARVVPGFERFLVRFPSVEALARAPRSEVVRAWAGLGHNRRAVALSEAARIIARDHAGHVPPDPGDLRRLPGVGPYTASAVAALAFRAPVPALDTNVRRVIARVLAGTDPEDVPPSRVLELAEGALDRDAPGEWNQALMDLGRDVCRPRPRCERCPLASRCRFRAVNATPRPSSRPAPPFEGSTRQVRGAVVAVLRRRTSASFRALVRETGFAPRLVGEAVVGLRRDGLVEAGPAALEGRPAGRIRLRD